MGAREPGEPTEIGAEVEPISDALVRTGVETRLREIKRVQALEAGARPTTTATDLDGAEHLEHLLNEAKRLLGATWANLSDIRAAWDGGGLRTNHATVDKLKAVLGWARAEEHPRAALTRALEGFRHDSFARQQGYTLRLFASEPSRYARSGRALSSAPSQAGDPFDTARLPAFLADLADAPSDRDVAELATVLRDMHAKRYAAKYGETGPRPGPAAEAASHRVARWCLEKGAELALGHAERFIDGAFAHPHFGKAALRGKWEIIGKEGEDFGAISAASTQPSPSTSNQKRPPLPRQELTDEETAEPPAPASAPRPAVEVIPAIAPFTWRDMERVYLEAHQARGVTSPATHRDGKDWSRRETCAGWCAHQGEHGGGPSAQEWAERVMAGAFRNARVVPWSALELRHLPELASDAPIPQPIEAAE